MDPFERHFRRSFKPDAIIAFVVAAVAAYIIETVLGVYNTLLTMIIVAGVGGFWYKLRNVV
jgi:uncharacterized membrane protein